LIALGVQAHDKVAVLATNVPEWVVLEMALPKAAAVLVTVNTNYQRSELEYLLRQADVHTLILMQQHRGNSYVKSLRHLLPELDAIREPDKEEVRSTSFPSFRRAILLGDENEPGLVPYARLRELGHAVSRSRPRRAPVERAHARRVADPVHERDHGRAEGCDDHVPWHAQQRAARREDARGSRATTGT
jgi:fatty-acyl-CoA synthase